MALAAVFNATKDGGWEGWLRTLTINAKLRLVPNDDRANDRAPDFKVYVGRAEVGAAWRQASQVSGTGERFSLKLSDPAFPAGLSMTLFENEGGATANLTWQPKRTHESER